MKIDTATAQGARPYQEDRFIAERVQVGKQSYYIFAIMDGHSGGGTAEYCREHLVSIFEKVMGSAPAFDGKVLTDVVKELAERTNQMFAGSVLSLVITENPFHTAFIAVLGDSIVAIKNKSGDMFIAPEHNVRSNLAERNAAISRGGVYVNGYIWSRGGKGLQMSRSLGDSLIGEIVSREPEIFEVELGEESIILVASDGLLDPAHLQEPAVIIQEVMRLIELGETAKQLVHTATEVEQTNDNVTVMIARCEPAA